MAQTWRRAGSMQKKFTRLSASSASLTETVIIVITWTTCINYVMKIIFERLRVLDLACLVKARQAQVSTCIEFTNPPLRWQVPLPFLKKKWPTLKTDPVPAGITKKRPFLCFAKMRKTVENLFFFLPRKHPKSAKRLILIWEKGTFFFAQLYPSWLEHGVHW